MSQTDFFANIPSGHENTRAKSFLAFQGDSKLHPESFKGMFKRDKTDTPLKLLKECFNHRDCNHALGACTEGKNGGCTSDANAKAAKESYRKGSMQTTQTSYEKKHLHEAEESYKKSSTIVEKGAGKFAYAAGAPCYKSAEGTYCETRDNIDYSCLPIPAKANWGNTTVTVCIDPKKKEDATAECWDPPCNEDTAQQPP